MATDHRSTQRAVAFPFRMSRADREQLDREVRAGGYSSLQQLLEAKVFGKAKAARRPGPQPQEERLDIGA